MKKAIVTGITGQDGSYLAELLLGKSYEVHGITRRTSSPNISRVKHLQDKEHFSMHCGDLLDAHSMCAIINNIQPDEIYNLAAQSDVRVSFDQPSFTSQVNAEGVLHILEAIKTKCPQAKMYQASTSEMFGGVNPPTTGYTEESPFAPRNPYACAKLYAYWITRNYRDSYGTFACNGILFNHECLKYDYPLLIKYQGLIDIYSIQDLAKKFANFSAETDNKTGTLVKDLYVWDNEDWTSINCISWFKNQNKNIKIINARNTVYSVTDDHVCVLKDDSEVKALELRIKDKVKSIPYPNNEKQLVELTLEEAELLGMLVGDGTLKYKQFTNKNANLRGKFEYLWQTVTRGTCSYSPSISGFTGEIIGRLNLHGGKEWIAKFQIDTECVDVFGRTYKKIPIQILNSAPDVMEAFLVGYNATDGLKANPCVYRFKNFKTNSPILAAGLLYLIDKTTNQRTNITIEESWKWGKQQFHYSINLLTDTTSNLEKYKIVKEKLAKNLSQREIHRQTGVSRTMIKKIKAGYTPSHTRHLELAKDEIKKIITIPSENYTGWLFDIETKSGTLHSGIGTSLIHNSSRRGPEFVTKKITNWCGKFLRKETKDVLELGNLNSWRDWGHAKDYVKAMYEILQAPEPDDWLVATGEKHTVREFVERCFDWMKKPLTWSGEGIDEIGTVEGETVIKINPRYFRPSEVSILIGDCTKIRTQLGWKPEISFEQLIDEMMSVEITC